MRHVALQIVDLNNPLSVEYSKRSIETFNPVNHLLEIIPFQCFTPATIPTDNVYKDKKNRTLFEQACFASHYYLVKKLSEGENFIIMEHDAYLRPDKIDAFTSLLQDIDNYYTFNLGIANEFYKLSAPVARRYVSIVNKRKMTGGPMAVARNSTFQLQKKLLKKVPPEDAFSLWPVIGQKNQISKHNNIEESVVGKGKIYDAPITQFFITNKGNTITERANRWKYTPENNPDMIFIDE